MGGTTVLRRLQESDLAAIKASHRQLFGFDLEEDVSLEEAVRTSRYLSIAAVNVQPDGTEQLAGFVVSCIATLQAFSDAGYRSDADESGPSTAAMLPLGGPEGLGSLVPVGFHPGDRAINICLLGVFEEFRRSKVATTMLQQVVNSARDSKAALIFLHVMTNNAAARRFYLKNGFRVAAHIAGFYPVTPGNAFLLYNPLQPLDDAGLAAASAAEMQAARAAAEAMVMQSRNADACNGGACSGVHTGPSAAGVVGVAMDQPLYAATIVPAADDWSRIAADCSLMTPPTPEVAAAAPPAPWAVRQAPHEYSSIDPSLPRWCSEMGVGSTAMAEVAPPAATGTPATTAAAAAAAAAAGDGAPLFRFCLDGGQPSVAMSAVGPGAGARSGGSQTFPSHTLPTFALSEGAASGSPPVASSRGWVEGISPAEADGAASSAGLSPGTAGLPARAARLHGAHDDDSGQPSTSQSIRLGVHAAVACTDGSRQVAGMGGSAMGSGAKTGRGASGTGQESIIRHGSISSSSSSSHSQGAAWVGHENMISRGLAAAGAALRAVLRPVLPGWRNWGGGGAGRQGNGRSIEIGGERLLLVRGADGEVSLLAAEDEQDQDEGKEENEGQNDWDQKEWENGRTAAEKAMITARLGGHGSERPKAAAPVRANDCSSGSGGCRPESATTRLASDGCTATATAKAIGHGHVESAGMCFTSERRGESGSTRLQWLSPQLLLQPQLAGKQQLGRGHHYGPGLATSGGGLCWHVQLAEMSARPAEVCLEPARAGQPVEPPFRKQVSQGLHPWPGRAAPFATSSALPAACVGPACPRHGRPGVVMGRSRQRTMHAPRYQQPPRQTRAVAGAAVKLPALL